MAEEEEIGSPTRPIEQGIAKEHAVQVRHLGPGAHFAGDRLLDAAHQDGERLCLAEHQVSLAALGHRGKASLQPLRHRPQRDDSRHADGDANQCKNSATFAAK